MSTHYSESEVKERLTFLTDWKLEDNKLHRELKFNDFVEAAGFITRLAIHAEKRNHHPELFNVYNTVKIWLTTHDAGGITDKDFDLAEAIDSLVA